jgi:hypothetical protein
MNPYSKHIIETLVKKSNTSIPFVVYEEDIVFSKIYGIHFKDVITSNEVKDILKNIYNHNPDASIFFCKRASRDYAFVIATVGKGIDAEVYLSDSDYIKILPKTIDDISKLYMNKREKMPVKKNNQEISFSMGVLVEVITLIIVCIILNLIGFTPTIAIAMGICRMNAVFMFLCFIYYYKDKYESFIHIKAAFFSSLLLIILQGLNVIL